VANGALLEVSDAKGQWLFRSPQFALGLAANSFSSAGSCRFLYDQSELSQYRIAMQQSSGWRTGFSDLRRRFPTEPFDQALDSFRIIEKECLPLLVLLASLLAIG